MNKISKTDDEIIEIILGSLHDNALGDVKKASKGGAKMGAFILCSCLIDAIAGFELGRKTNKNDYISFVNRLLPSYDGTDLYSDLRCKLVHSYSEGGTYKFIHSSPGQHLIADYKRTINLDDFILEIQSVLESFSNQLRNKSEVAARSNAIRRYKNNGIIEVFPTANLMTPEVSGSHVTK